MSIIEKSDRFVREAPMDSVIPACYMDVRMYSVTRVIELRDFLPDMRREEIPE